MEMSFFSTDTHIRLFPYLLYPLQNIAMVCSIYLTVIIAVERYLAVSRPLSSFVEDGNRRWRKVFVFVFPVVAFSILFNLPTFFEFYIIEVPYYGEFSRLKYVYNESKYSPVFATKYFLGRRNCKTFWASVDLLILGEASKLPKLNMTASTKITKLAASNQFSIRYMVIF